MGMEQKVVLPAGQTPVWPKLADHCVAQSFPLKVMMIDGELAFPDETPGDAWREVRVGTAHGMVTLRRAEDGVHLVTWGNAEGPVRAAWETLARLVAEAFEGTVVS